MLAFIKFAKIVISDTKPRITRTINKKRVTTIVAVEMTIKVRLFTIAEFPTT